MVENYFRKSICFNVNSRTTSSDYYPFGMLMPGRTLSTEDYRFGFNGQERSDNLKGVGKMNTAKFWEYDTRLGRRYNLDPKPNAQLSSYCVFNDNPVKFTDVLGDVVKLDGFSEKKILRILRNGINASKDETPYYFDNNHELQIDKDKASKLTVDQKNILKNIDETVQSDIVFTIKKSADSDYIPGAITTGGAPANVGGSGGAATFPNLGADKLPDFSGKSGITVFWNGQAATNLFESNGNFVVEPPYSILYHELGGHGSIRYVSKIEQIQARGLTIDYENLVRELHGLPYRRYDETHPNPISPIKPFEVKSLR